MMCQWLSYVRIDRRRGVAALLEVCFVSHAGEDINRHLRCAVNAPASLAAGLAATTWARHRFVPHLVIQVSVAQIDFRHLREQVVHAEVVFLLLYLPQRTVDKREFIQSMLKVFESTFDRSERMLMGRVPPEVFVVVQGIFLHGACSGSSNRISGNEGNEAATV